ncbi:hypothetical protein SAMN02990966_03875 [Rhodospirillales bacterium URHD0017]|nr:hypothetical protein SAMN02990966_03875 [Rhodospirillales bacterium URHD0017]
MPRRLGLPLSLMILVGACAGSPSAPPQADQQAKQFDPPAPAKGALYVYRSGLMGAMRPLDVSLAGGAGAQLGYNTFIRIEGPPGPIDIACKVGDNTTNNQIQIQDGQTRFVEVSMRAGLWTPSCDVAEVPPTQGQTAVRSSRRVEPL